MLIADAVTDVVTDGDADVDDVDGYAIAFVVYDVQFTRYTYF